MTQRQDCAPSDTGTRAPILMTGSARSCWSIRHCLFSWCHFLCVILERSEESRCLFFALFFGLFFVSFRAAAAKNPGSFAELQINPTIETCQLLRLDVLRVLLPEPGFFAPQTPLRMTQGRTPGLRSE